MHQHISCIPFSPLLGPTVPSSSSITFCDLWQHSAQSTVSSLCHVLDQDIISSDICIISSIFLNVLCARSAVCTPIKHVLFIVTTEKFIAEGFYEESVRILTNYPVGVELLGKPIRCMKMDLGDRPNNYTDGYQAKVCASWGWGLISREHWPVVLCRWPFPWKASKHLADCNAGAAATRLKISTPTSLS